MHRENAIQEEGARPEVVSAQYAAAGVALGKRLAAAAVGLPAARGAQASGGACGHRKPDDYISSALRVSMPSKYE